MSLANILWAVLNTLWAVLVILLMLWLLAWLAATIGPFIHILLVLAVVVFLYNLLVSRRTAV